MISRYLWKGDVYTNIIPASLRILNGYGWSTGKKTEFPILVVAMPNCYFLIGRTWSNISLVVSLFGMNRLLAWMNPNSRMVEERSDVEKPVLPHEKKGCSLHFYIRLFLVMQIRKTSRRVVHAVSAVKTSVDNPPEEKSDEGDWASKKNRGLFFR